MDYFGIFCISLLISNIQTSTSHIVQKHHQNTPVHIHNVSHSPASATKREINGCPEPSEVIPLKDIQDALRGAMAASDEKSVVGQIIPDTNYQITVVKEDFLPGDETGFRVLVAEQGATTMVVFRGTNSEEQLLLQIKSFIKDTDGVEWEILGQSVQAFPIFLNPVLLLLPAIKHKMQDPSRKYIITGSSMGGAMASILSLKMVEDGNNIWENKKSSLITFGQPRTGNRAFAELHDERIHTYRKLRFVHNKDPVPHIPLWPIYVHHSREIFMEEKTGGWREEEKKRYWKVCNLKEDSSCSKKNSLTPNVKDHSLREYAKYIINPPDYYKVRGGMFAAKVNSFQESIMQSCNAGKRKK